MKIAILKCAATFGRCEVGEEVGAVVPSERQLVACAVAEAVCVILRHVHPPTQPGYRY